MSSTSRAIITNMGAVVFDNQVFDSWLTQKSQEILSKVDRERITTEEMLVLILKAQTNHFHHMDMEFREEFQKADRRIGTMDSSFKEEFRRIDRRFEAVDHKFERLWTFLMWQGGALLAAFGGLYLKLFLG